MSDITVPYILQLFDPVLYPVIEFSNKQLPCWQTQMDITVDDMCYCCSFKCKHVPYRWSHQLFAMIASSIMIKLRQLIDDYKTLFHTLHIP